MALVHVSQRLSCPSKFGGRRRAVRAWLLILLFAAGGDAFLADPTRGAGSLVAANSTRSQPDPRLRRRLDASLLAAGGLGLLASQAIPIHHLAVPPEGLDPADVRLAVDRRTIRPIDTAAGRTSSVILSAAVAFPLVLSALSAPSGERPRATLRRVVPCIEAAALNQALTEILKHGTSRPRPYLYANAVEHPGAHGATRAGNAFLSFPSGHSSGAWCVASFGVADHVLSRPRASWEEHAAVGFLGGALAAYTGWLRVRAGEHFPSDVAAGALVGSACGVGVPMLHRYVIDDQPAPPPRPARRVWLGALGGTLAGAAAVILLAPAVY